MGRQPGERQAQPPREGFLEAGKLWKEVRFWSLLQMWMRRRGESDRVWSQASSFGLSNSICYFAAMTTYLTEAS